MRETLSTCQSITYHLYSSTIYGCLSSIYLSPIYLLLLLLLSRFSCVRLCVTPKTAAHQAPPSLGFSRQEHWSGLPLPSPPIYQHLSIICHIYHVSLSLSIYIYINIKSHLTYISPSTICIYHLYIYLSNIYHNYLPTNLPKFLSLYHYIYHLYIYLSIHPPICLSIYRVCVCVCVCVHAQLLRCVCQTLCSPMDYIARQAPLFMEFSRQEYWSRLPFPTPGDLPDHLPSMSVYLSVHCLSVHPSFCLSIPLSLSPSIHPSLHSFSSIHPFLSFSTRDDSAS